MTRRWRRTSSPLNRPNTVNPAELIRSIITSCTYAFNGILLVIRSQRNFRVHLCAAFVVLLAGGLLHFSRLEMVLLVLTVCLVILGELLNTALEFILNLLEARDHPVVKAAKDVAAGGVFMAVLGSIAVALLLFGPRLLLLIQRR